MGFGIEYNFCLIENRQNENAAKFVYLGSILTWDNNCTKDIKARIRIKE